MENKSLERDANSLTDVISSLISEIEEWEQKHYDAEKKIEELQQDLDNANEMVVELTEQLNSK